MKKIIMLGSMLLAPSCVHAMLQTCFRYLNTGLSTATLIETFNVPQTTTYEITEPGIYVLAQDYMLTATVAMPAIHIRANGVQLDLNRCTVAHDGLTQGVMGIKVDAGLTGVSITNGVIVGFTGTAILFEAGNTMIQLKDLVLKNCFSRAIECLGTLADPIAGGVLQKIVISECALLGDADIVMNLEHVYNVYINDVGISSCGNPENPITIVKLVDVKKCQCIFPALVSNIGTELTGFDLVGCQNNIFLNAKVINNTASGSNNDFVGVNVSVGSTGNIFRQLNVLNNRSLLGDCLCVSVGSACAGNIFQAMQIMENIGQSCVGIHFLGTGSPSNNINNMIESSWIVRNSSTVGACTGILLDVSDEGCIRNTRIGYNRAANVATGILFNTGGNNWSVRGCEFFKNEGPQGTNNENTDSYGVRILAGTDNIFVQNLAYQNGANPLNQLNGAIFPFSLTPLTSVQYVTPSTVSLATAPWVNVAVVDTLPII